MEMKTCRQCGQTKQYEEFKKGSGTGRTCKSCQHANCRKYKQTHKELISDYNKIYKAKNANVISQYNHKYNLEHRESIQKRQNVQHSERKKYDVNYRLSCALRSRLNGIFKEKSHEHTLVLLGCTLDFFRIWIEYNFDEDMTFENYGKYWHIDHVIPCSVFKLEDKDEQTKCFHWTNLQPLERIENLRKNDTLTKEMIDKQKYNIKKFLKKYKDEFDSETYTLIKYNKYAYLQE